MTLAHLTYRASQLLKFLRKGPSIEQLELARRVLSTVQLDLFLQMQPSEQAHSLEILGKLMDQGESDPDLLVAALLHDAGKSRFPLRLLERAWIVIVKAVIPRLAQRWGQDLATANTPRWRRAMLVAEQHPQWGAEMALEAGASPLTVALIYRHQEKILSEPDSYENKLLLRLQVVDNES